MNGKRSVSKVLRDGGTQQGCLDLVDKGVIPNQFGTWVYGRAGWCPGWNVATFVADVTDAASLVPATRNIVAYEALFNGRPYNATPSSHPNGQGFPAQISLASYLVMYISRPAAPTTTHHRVVAAAIVAGVVTIAIVLVASVRFLRHQRATLSASRRYESVAGYLPQLDDHDNAVELPTRRTGSPSPRG